MTRNRGRSRQPSGPRGNLRPINRSDRNKGNYRPQGRKDPNKLDQVTKRRIQDDRILSALCHAGVFLGLWGIVSTAVIWVFRKEKSKTIRFQGAQAIMFQLTLQLLLFLGTMAYVVMALSGENGGDPQKAFAQAPDMILSSLLLTYISSGNVALTVSAVVKLIFGFVGSVFLLFSLLGLEPSYPLIGLVARRVLGLKSPEKPAEKKEKTPPEKPEPEKAEQEKTPVKS